MNEFTKEELEWLLHEVEHIAENHKHTHTKSLPVIEKLKTMIDDYCERKPNSKNYSGSQEDNAISECLWNMRCSDQFIQLIRKIITRELSWMKSYGNQ